eukprot:gene1776-2915_t
MYVDPDDQDYDMRFQKMGQNCVPTHIQQPGPEDLESSSSAGFVACKARRKYVPDLASHGDHEDISAHLGQLDLNYQGQGVHTAAGTTMEQQRLFGKNVTNSSQAPKAKRGTPSTSLAKRTSFLPISASGEYRQVYVRTVQTVVAEQDAREAIHEQEALKHLVLRGEYVSSLPRSLTNQEFNW